MKKLHLALLSSFFAYSAISSDLDPFPNVLSSTQNIEASVAHNISYDDDKNLQLLLKARLGNSGAKKAFRYNIRKKNKTQAESFLRTFKLIPKEIEKTRHKDGRLSYNVSIFSDCFGIDTAPKSSALKLMDPRYFLLNNQIFEIKPTSSQAITIKDSAN